jgi:hypothetical protein
MSLILLVKYFENFPSRTPLVKNRPYLLLNVKFPLISTEISYTFTRVAVSYNRVVSEGVCYTFPKVLTSCPAVSRTEISARLNDLMLFQVSMKQSHKIIDRILLLLQPPGVGNLDSDTHCFICTRQCNT